MPSPSLHIRSTRTRFRDVLSDSTLDAVARRSRFIRRERVVSAANIFWAFMVTLGAQPMEYISDVLRTLNAQRGLALRYKPFWNRIAQPAFCRFMKTMFAILCRDLVAQVLTSAKGSVSGYFSDILLDDGSSFAVARGLRAVFPGRFTKLTPAAVELHAHMSLRTGNPCNVVLAPDKEAERQFLPPARTLPRRSLSLRDRGYVDLEYFEALAETEAFLICRASNTLNPTIVRVLGGLPKRAAKRWEGQTLQTLRKSMLRHDLDLQVSWPRKRARSLQLRLVIRYVREKKSWTWLLTNLPPHFSADDIGQLYRLRCRSSSSSRTGSRTPTSTPCSPSTPPSSRASSGPPSAQPFSSARSPRFPNSYWRARSPLDSWLWPDRIYFRCSPIGRNEASPPRC